MVRAADRSNLILRCRGEIRVRVGSGILFYAVGGVGLFVEYRAGQFRRAAGVVGDNTRLGRVAVCARGAMAIVAMLRQRVGTRVRAAKGRAKRRN